MSCIVAILAQALPTTPMSRSRSPRRNVPMRGSVAAAAGPEIVVPLQGVKATERSNFRTERSNFRSAERKQNPGPPGSVRAKRRYVSQEDPPPPLCNRSAVPWGTEVAPEDCQCEAFAAWLGRHSSLPQDVVRVANALDVEGPKWKLADSVSYWRPGGRHLSERWWYNAKVLDLTAVRFPRCWRVVAQLN